LRPRWNAPPADRAVAEVVELVRHFRLDLVDIVDDSFLVDRQRGVGWPAALSNPA
jgi:hypothetical protein